MTAGSLARAGPDGYRLLRRFLTALREALAAVEF